MWPSVIGRQIGYKDEQENNYCKTKLEPVTTRIIPSVLYTSKKILNITNSYNIISQSYT